MAEKDDDELIAHPGTITHRETGEVKPALLYHAEDEDCHAITGCAVDDSFERWEDHNGTICLRHKGEHHSASVGGGSKPYTKNYDSIDWGN